MSSSRSHPKRSASHVIAEARQICAQLRALGDPERAQGMEAFFSHEIVGLGIKTPTVRALLRERVRTPRRQWPAADAIALCDRLLREPEFELRIAGIFFLAPFHRQLSRNFLRQAERWLETQLDNWAYTDCFCGEVLAPLLEHEPIEPVLRTWSRSKSLWVRRAALVTLVPSARHGERLDLAYRLVRAHFRDPEDLMHKAMGWLLRECGRHDRPRLKHFLLQHGPALPRTTLRYAIEHFPAVERLRLLADTRREKGAHSFGR